MAGVVTPVVTQESTASTQVVDVTNKIENKISQKTGTTVKDISNMKTIASLKDLETIKQEEFGEISIASVQGTIKAEMERISAEYAKQVKAEKELVENAGKVTKETQEKLDLVTKELGEIKAKQAKADADSKFNVRMGHLDENFELDDEQKQSIASQIKDLEDTAFDAWLKSFEVIAKKNKKAKKPVEPDADDAKDGKKGAVATASVTAPTVATATGKVTATAALDSAVADPVVVANATSTAESELEVLKKAFSLEGMTVK